MHWHAKRANYIAEDSQVIEEAHEICKIDWRSLMDGWLLLWVMGNEVLECYATGNDQEYGGNCWC